VPDIHDISRDGLFRKHLLSKADALTRHGNIIEIIHLEMHQRKEGAVVKSKAFVQPRSKDSKRLRVLMADPDESLHRIYRAPVLREGFAVERAANGLDFVARLRERRTFLPAYTAAAEGPATVASPPQGNDEK
jgi:hypothetical protein